MSEFPDDVLNTARNHFADATMRLPPGEVFSTIDLIARAILVERERCARVADAKALDLKFNDLSARQHGQRKEAEGYAYAFERCAEVASAIRDPLSIMGMRVVADPSLPTGTARIVNPDGSIAAEIVNTKPSTGKEPA